MASSKVQIGVGFSLSDFDRGIAKMQKSLGGLGGHAMDIAKLAGGFALAEIGVQGFEKAVASCIAFVKGLSEEAAQIADSAGQVGMDTDSYQIWGRMLKTVGGDAEDLGKSVQTMTDVIADAGRGGDEAQAKLGRLGLSFEKLKDKSVSERLQTVAEALSDLSVESDRINAAGDIFGSKSGRGFASMAGSFDELKTAAEMSGVVFSKEWIKAADELDDKMLEIVGNVKAASSEMFGGALEKLADTASALADVSGGKGAKTLAKGGGSEANMSQGFWEEYVGILGGKGWLWDENQVVYFPAPTSDDIDALKKHTEEMKKSKGEREKLRAETATRKADEEKSKKEQKALDTYTGSIKALDQQLKLQQLLLEGKESEAALQKQIYDLESKMGRGLTDKEKSSLAAKQDELDQLKLQQQDVDDKKAGEASVSASARKYQDELAIQKLKDQGLDKEAEFLKAQQDFHNKFGTTMTPEEAQKTADAIDRKYDYQDQRGQDTWNKKLEAEQQAPDQLARIGLSLGGDGAMTVQRESLTVQKQMVVHLAKIAEGSLGSSVPVLSA